jgi:hypothetical protein
MECGETEGTSERGGKRMGKIGNRLMICSDMTNMKRI